MGLKSNEIQQWIASDKSLSNVLLEIERTSDAIDVQAEIAFHKISEMYKVAKLPEDTDDDSDEDEDDRDYIEETSVYEQLGLLKYLQPNEDLRGLVLSAIYFVRNGYRADVEEVMFREFGGNIPDDIGIGFRGDTTDVSIVFVPQGQDWIDLGCKMFTKYV